MDFDDYETAKNLYEQWELLDREGNSYQEEVESDVRKIAGLPSDSDKGIVMLGQEANDTVPFVQLLTPRSSVLEGTSKTEVNLMNAMRMLWEEHVAWTRMHPFITKTYKH